MKYVGNLRNGFPNRVKNFKNMKFAYISRNGFQIRKSVANT